jgi:DNA replication protein DnaD
MRLQQNKKRKIPSSLQIVTHLSVKHYKATNRISEAFIYRCNKYIHIQTDRRRIVQKDLKNEINLEIKTQNTQSVLPHSTDSRYSAFSLPVPYSMTRFSSHTRTHTMTSIKKYTLCKKFIFILKV